jgi:hypothetical protein
MFSALVVPVAGGHVTVSFELHSRLDAEVPHILGVIHGLVPPAP